MIPLPYRLQCLAAKIITAVIRSMRSPFLIPHVWFEPCSGATSDVAGNAEIGISILPCHGYETASASHGIEVEHRHRPPFAVGSIHNTALMYSGASHIVAAAF